MPDIRASYDILAYARFEGLRQSGYKLVKLDVHRQCFQLQCSGRENVDFSTTSRESCDDILDKLIKAGLKIKYRSHADWKFLFTVKPVVPVEVVFEPHIDGDSVRLTVKNLDEIGLYVENLTPGRINESFFEQPQQCVLRKPNNFSELLGNQIPDDRREKFRNQIAARQQERELDADTVEFGEATPINRLKGLLGRFTAKNKS
jgi:hypothetical protein